MLSIASDLIERLVNTSGKKTTLYCPVCDDVTEHVTISWAEMHRFQRQLKEQGKLVQGIFTVGGIISDINPLMMLAYGRPCICTNRRGEEAQKCFHFRTEKRQELNIIGL